jgi:hypothetical protein
VPSALSVPARIGVCRFCCSRFLGFHDYSFMVFLVDPTRLRLTPGGISGLGINWGKI